MKEDIHWERKRSTAAQISYFLDQYMEKDGMSSLLLSGHDSWLEEK